MQSEWGWLVAIYLFLGGLGAGAFLVAAFFEFTGKRQAFEFCPPTIVGATLSGPLVGIGALLLIFDLGAGLREPTRIFQMFSNPHSVMSWGIVILSAFIPFALAYGVLELIDTFRKKAPAAGAIKRVIAAIGSLLAVATGLYTGVLISAVGPAIPFWSTPLPPTHSLPVMPFLFLVSAISTGMSLTVLLGGSLSKDNLAEKVRQLPIYHLVLIVLEIILVVLLLASAQGEGGVTAQAVQALLSGQHRLAFWAFFVAPGFIVPMAALVLNKLGKHWRGLEFAEGVCIIFAGLLLRYLVLISGIPVTL